ncbi:MAG TPA: hypothetical protein VJN44_05805 [Roseateles sp.]|nr:hypothetical protein [Roseateles sp.]
MNKIKTLAAAALLALAGAAQAAAVYDANGFGASRVVTFNGYDGLLTTGSEDVGTAEVGMAVWMTSGPNAEIGAVARDLGENGLWTGFGAGPATEGHFLASSFVARRGELGFSFDMGVKSVGAYMNQFQSAAGGNAFTVLAYGKSGDVLEQFSYSVDTDWDGYDQGQFLGFSRASADIYGFGVAGNNIVLDNLSFTTAVPEPDEYLMLLAGLLVIGTAVSRRRHSR